uniref:Uncharacterized protein n=1 Tax=Percolomonas cosmopolitus TaxID=63605 RepID=A0A7S1KNX4_9EUKA|mmetsp:Transcript_2659/g.10210  ORF Transcript_2659/g.10210 Transcript_2659/m.10210 type:complete len:649 (+) Transcript_2659:60-2006(+)
MSFLANLLSCGAISRGKKKDAASNASSTDEKLYQPTTDDGQYSYANQNLSSQSGAPQTGTSANNTTTTNQPSTTTATTSSSSSSAAAATMPSNQKQQKTQGDSSDLPHDDNDGKFGNGDREKVLSMEANNHTPQEDDEHVSAGKFQKTERHHDPNELSMESSSLTSSSTSNSKSGNTISDVSSSTNSTDGQAPQKSFIIHLIDTIKPSVSKLSSAPPCLSFCGGDIFVAEHLSAYIVPEEDSTSAGATSSQSSLDSSNTAGSRSSMDSLSSKTPVRTKSVIRKLHRDAGHTELQHETADLRGAVLEMQLIKDYLIVCYAENKVEVRHRSNLELVQQIKTRDTLMSCCFDANVFACLHHGQHKGTITIHDLHEPENPKQTHLKAHRQPVKRFCFNLDGSLLASTSRYATTIKLFNTMNQQKIKEMRRGYKTANIYNMVFSADSQVLAAFSNLGLHLFSLGHDERLSNTFSSLYALSYMGASIYGSEWAAIEDNRFKDMFGYAQFEWGSHTRLHYFSFTGHHFAISFENTKDKNAPPVLVKTQLNEIFDAPKKKRKFLKFPDRLPLMVTPRARQTDIPVVCHNKMLIPKHMTCDQLRIVIGKQLRRTTHQLRVWIGGAVRAGYLPVQTLFDTHKEESGFLVVEYDFGGEA